MDTKLRELRRKIRLLVPSVGVLPYSHNIIGLYLMSIASRYGIKEANKAICDFGLERLGWSKVQEGSK